MRFIPAVSRVQVPLSLLKNPKKPGLVFRIFLFAFLLLRQLHPVLNRSTSIFFPESGNKIRGIRETCIQGNIIYGIGRTCQKLSGGVKPCIQQILMRRISGFLFEERAESGNAQIRLSGQNIQGQGLRIVIADVADRGIDRIRHGSVSGMLSAVLSAGQ